MKFLVDAQLPHLLARRLDELGHEAKHTLDLTEGNRTPDGDIAILADKMGAVVITKDSDFLDSHLLKNSPQSLLVITTGNISNYRLIRLFEQNIEQIVFALSDTSIVELSQTGLIVRGG